MRGMTTRYDTKRWAAAPFSATASSWKGATHEMHAYPLQPREGMEDGGFEIKIILQEKSNVFAFPIEDAKDLDFFDQPKPSPEEVAEGTVRPENVINSYAVYPKAKTNHRVADTLYSTDNRVARLTVASKDGTILARRHRRGGSRTASR
jgi:hypothetical protein